MDSPSYCSLSGTFQSNRKRILSSIRNLTDGGAANIHPKARLCRKILGLETARELSEVVASLGLAQNFAAVFALSTVGIQKGHMSLHAKNIAVMAGAQGDEIDKVADKLVNEGKVKLDRAKEILDEIK